MIQAPGPFNYSHLNNRGVTAASGSLVCFLNNDTEVLDPDWLLELASRLAEPSTGAVAPVLTWPKHSELINRNTTTNIVFVFINPFIFLKLDPELPLIAV